MAMGGANAPAYGTSSFSPAAYLYGLPSADTLRMDDLLDLSNNDHFTADVHHLPVQPDYASATTPVGSKPSGCFSDQCYPHSSTSFADDIYVPSEEAAELEWLSKFVEDSFSDVPYPPASIPNTAYSNTQIRTDHATANRGARSKRSRAPTAAAAVLTAAAAAAGNWPLQRQASSSSASSSSSSDFGGGRRRSAGGAADSGVGVDESGVRRCTHCASEKTPQWRAGPLGPKTLCNACGVRYKSGRLVPEYRPAASPSFVLTQHSNSHRKVVELRRQKEEQQQHRHQPSSSSRLDLMYS